MSTKRNSLQLAYSILHDEQLALDCVQEAFIKAGLNAHKLRRTDRASSWLTRIVVNECISQRRRNRREIITNTIEEQGYEETYPSDSGIWKNVNRLPDKLRIPLLLFYYHDLGFKEISSALGLNEATCRVRLHRARTKLRELMEGEKDE